MKKKRNVIAVLIFIVVLILPLLIWPFNSFLDKTILTENRNLASAPKFSNDYFIDLDKYLTDHAPLRNAVINGYSRFDNQLTKWYQKLMFLMGYDYYTTKNGVIIGEQDWLFYELNETLVQYKGLNQFSEKILDNYVNKAEKVYHYFATQGKQFCIMIAPNKEEIYSEYMPYIHVENKIKQIDNLANYFAERSNVPVVYPKQELIQAKQFYAGRELYYKQDTHWNELGALVGTNKVLNSLGINAVTPDMIVNVDKIGGDLLSMIAGTPAIYSEPCVKFDNQEHENNKNLLLIGDSFRIGMRPTLEKAFTNLTIAHRSDYYQGNINYDDFASADIIILETVERLENDIFGDGGLLDSLIDYFNL